MIDKNEMLEVFKEMLRLWELIAQSKDGLVYESRKCITGFCYYLLSNEPSNVNNYLKVLEEDRVNYQDYSLKGYWYPMYYNREFYFDLIDFQIVIENQFQPRIDHLKRTIARLEN